MVIEINIIPGVKVTIKTIAMDMTAKGSNVFNVTVGDRACECPLTPLNGNLGR